MSKYKFPPMVYVTKDGEGTNELMYAHEDVSDIGAQPCAVYKLVKVGEVQVKASVFVETKK